MTHPRRPTRTARPSRAPLLLIGLDAMDVELVERWAAEGVLPGFRRLFETAAHGRLDSPVQVMQGSIWPSFVTGLDPGDHGLYFMAQIRPGSAELRRMQAADLRQPPFWARPGPPAGPVAVVDVPKLRLVARPGDAQVVEWGALDHFSAFSTHPAPLAGELLRRFGRHPLQAPLQAPWGALGRRRLRRRLERGMERKDALNRWLLRRFHPRLLLTVFGETHAAGHYLWPRDDGSGTTPPDPSAGGGPSAGGLGAVYARLDRILSAMVADHAGQANIIVFSGHGMTRDTIPSGVLEALLARMGLLVRPAGPSGGRTRAVARLAGRLPYGMRRLANELLIPPAVQRRLLEAKGIGADPAASQAFVLPSDHQGFIRINLAGREPQGSVRPEDYDALCERIEGEALALADAETGAPIVERVLRTRALYPGGGCLDALPDLCVVWKERARRARIVHPRHGPIPAGARHPERPGNHRLEGFFFALGPDIDTTARGLRANLLDLAPAAMRLLSGGVPEGLAGETLPILR